jgi:NADH-quinone oxidoreductase subunit A
VDRAAAARIAANAWRSDSLRPVALEQYLPFLSLLALVVLFVALSFVASVLLGPRRPTAAKEAPYECGIVPDVEPVEHFPVKFYIVAMAFIVLDVEIIFLYPFTTVLKGLAGYGLVVMGVFLLVALVPFGYLLSTGAVEWGPVRQVVERVGARVLRAAGAPGRDGLDPRRPVPSVEEEAA